MFSLLYCCVNCCDQYIWAEEDGFLLHPSIPLVNTPKIADIGTGTGYMKKLCSYFCIDLLKIKEFGLCK